MLVSGVCLPDEEAFISMEGDCRYPAVATEGSCVFLAWLATEVRPASLYFRRSIDEGRTWNGARKISNENGDCMPPSIAVNSGIVHLAWIDCGEVIDGEMYYTRSLDGGDTWEKNRILIGNANSAQHPLISCGGSNVYLIWTDVGHKVFFKASHDQGRTWENETLLGEVGKHSCYCFPPALSVDGDGLTVAWTSLKEDKKGFRLLELPVFTSKKKEKVSSLVCRKSGNNGRTWSREHVLTKAKVAGETQDEIDNPTMLSDGLRSYIFWLDKRNLPLGELFYARFDSETKEGSLAGKKLYSAPKRSPRRSTAVFDKNGNLHFAWATFFNWQSIVHYGVIDRAGNILKEKQDLTLKAGRYENPTIARTPSGILHIFWFNKPADKNERARIFLKTSQDNGLTWENRGPQTTDVQN